MGQPTIIERPGGREGGATSVEYAILAALIAAVIITAVVVVGQGTQGNLECYNDSRAAQTYAC